MESIQDENEIETDPAFAVGAKVRVRLEHDDHDGMTGTITKVPSQRTRFVELGLLFPDRQYYCIGALVPLEPPPTDRRLK